MFYLEVSTSESQYQDQNLQTIDDQAMERSLQLFWRGELNYKYNVDEWKGWWKKGHKKHLFLQHMLLQHPSSIGFAGPIFSVKVGGTINVIDCFYRKSNGMKDNWSEREIEWGEKTGRNTIEQLWHKIVDWKRWEKSFLFKKTKGPTDVKREGKDYGK